MNERMIKKVSLSALSFGSLFALSFCFVVSFSARAQEIIEIPVEDGAIAEEAPTLISQPVVVTRGMAPTTVPQALSQSQSQAQAQSQTQVTTQVTTELPQRSGRVAVVGRGDREVEVASPSTGIGGSNPGNANTGGVQIVSVQANPNNSNDVAQGSNNRSDILRRERLRHEVNNETRLLERLEEGRMSDEARRMKAIEGYKASVGVDQDIDTVNVTSATTTAKADNGSTANATTTIVSPVTSVNSADTDIDQRGGFGAGSLRYGYGMMGLGGAFKLSPFIGYRWYQDNAALDAQNRFVTGLAMEGRINDFIGIEGSFAYSQDEFKNQGNYASARFGGPSAFGSGSFGSAGCCGGGPEYYLRTRDTYEVNAGTKIGYQMGRIRPFGATGIGGLFRKYKIDDAVTTQMLNDAGLQRSSNHMVGNFGMGLDVAAGRNFLIGGRFDYQAILNKKRNSLQYIYGDSSNNYRISGNVQLVF